MSEQVRGIDFKDLRDESRSLSATIIGHGDLCAPPIEIGGMRLGPA